MDLTYRSRAQLITVKQNSFRGHVPSYTMAAYQQEANSYTWHVNDQDFEQHNNQQYHHQHHQPHHGPTQMMDVNTSWSY